MPAILPIIIAGVAALAILLIFLGLAGSAPVDPVQARLTQLGTMQAKNLEELELQAPFIERTLRPLATRLSGFVARVTSASFSERTEKRLALAGHPGNLRVGDWLGIKAIAAIVGAGIAAIVGAGIGFLFFGAPADRRGRRRRRRADRARAHRPRRPRRRRRGARGRPPAPARRPRAAHAPRRRGARRRGVLHARRMGRRDGARAGRGRCRTLGRRLLACRAS